MTAAFDHWAATADLRIRATETGQDHPWSMTYHVTGDDLADLARNLLAEARETEPGSALHNLITAVGSPTDARRRIRCESMSNSRRRASSLRTMLSSQKKLAMRWPRVTGSTRCTLVPG